MKLYCFREWNNKNRTIELTEWETDEVLFKEEFSKIKKGWTVVDVGSEFGYYAIKAGLFVGNDGKVLAIEPHPETYRVLKMNIELYGLNNVVPVCEAAGNETGEVILREATDPGGTTVVSPRPLYSLDRNRLLRWLKFIKSRDIFKIVRKKYAPVRYVPMDTLERITKEKNIEKVDLIKIDVEGGELDVLKGSYTILKNDEPILLVEVHHGCDWKPETLYGLLQNLGYSLIMEKRRTKTLVVAHFAGEQNEICAR